MKKTRILVVIPLLLLFFTIVSSVIMKLVFSSYFEISDFILAILLLISLILIFWSNKIKMHFYASYYVLGIGLFLKFIFDGAMVFRNGIGFYTAMMILSFTAAFLIFDYIFLETHSLLNVLKIKVITNILSFVLIALLIAMFILEFSYVITHTRSDEYTVIGILSSFINLFAVCFPLFGLHIERKRLS